MNDYIKNASSDALVNLASNEYGSVLVKEELSVPVVDIVFKEIKGNAAPKIISFYAKKARGTMARYMIDKEISSIEGLQQFDRDGYCYEPSVSSDKELVFYRKLDV